MPNYSSGTWIPEQKDECSSAAERSLLRPANIQEHLRVSREHKDLGSSVSIFVAAASTVEIPVWFGSMGRLVKMNSVMNKKVEWNTSWTGSDQSWAQTPTMVKAAWGQSDQEK